MGLYGWSNILEAGGGLSVKPLEELHLKAGYRFAALTSAGPWISSSARVFGHAGEREGFASAVLGHEIDFAATLTPWEPIEFKAGYGLFLFSENVKALTAPDPLGAQHWVFLQTLVHAP
jgi:hypothetical protein